MRGDPQVFSSTDLHTLGDLCQHLLSQSGAWSSLSLAMCSLYTGTSGCAVESKATENGPVINGMPDPNVAWSAYAYVHDVRVDLFGCGPTPRMAVECLARDIERRVERLRSAV